MSTRIIAVRVAGDRTESIPADLEALPALLEDPDVRVWVDLDSQDAASERVLRDVFSFHPLLIEDAFADASTPKVEEFGDYLYVIVHGLTDADPKDDGEVHTADLDLFLGERFLITHYRIPFVGLGQVRDEVQRDLSLLGRGTPQLAHRIIDRLVDEFLPVMEKLDHEVDAIEAMILANSSPALLERIFRMKHSTQRIRRVGLHQKNLLLALSEGRYDLVPEEVRPFFRDVYDHMVRVIDLNDAYRELLASSLDGYLSVQSHKLNEVMRVLTVFSTVMLPLTFITGLYGMNFDYMPYLHFQYGFEAAMGLMVAIAVAMFFFFKRRHWV